MKKHFSIVGTEQVNGRKLKRISARFDMPDYGVKAGDLGGLIESKRNLTDEAWIGYGAKAVDNSRVSGRSLVCGDSTICESASVSDSALVRNSFMSGHTSASRKAILNNRTFMHDYAVATFNCRISNSDLKERVEVSGDAKILDSTLSGWGDVRDRAVINKAVLMGNYRIVRNAFVSTKMYSLILNGGKIGSDAQVLDRKHVFQVPCMGYENRTVLMYRTINGHRINIGCWTGTIDELIPEVRMRKKEIWSYATEEEYKLTEEEYRGIYIALKARIKGFNNV